MDSPPHNFPPGQRLSRYLLLEQAGAGGMGVVYRARDERLGREVALKILPQGALADEAARRRFHREAQALSRINHPNIATVYDFDAQDGVDFLVMEYVPGETLDARLARGPLPEKEALALGLQLAQGLAAAHAQGFVHRDLKPANIKVTPEGTAKILDFGLARALDSHAGTGVTESLTQSRMVVGTLPFMPPEVLDGDRADERSDIYSLGAVLYQMCTGQLPFTDASASALTYSIVNVAPQPPAELNRRISGGLSEVLLKTLEKDPGRRHASARDLAVDLKRLESPSAGYQRRPPPRVRRGRGGIVGAMVGLAVVVGVLAWLNPGHWRDGLVGGAGARPIRSIAVLPLQNLSGDPAQDYFADGITEELIAHLAQIGALRVISRTSVMHYKQTTLTLPQIARELKVDAVVEGSVQQAEGRVRITAELVRAATDQHLWARTYERPARDVLAIQNDVAQDVAREIRIQVTQQEAARLARAEPVDPAAHEAYLRGRFYWEKRTEPSLLKSLEYYKEAIDRQPDYALAHAGIADSYIVLGNLLWMAPDVAYTRATASARRALEIDSTLAAAWAALAFVTYRYDWDLGAAETEFQRALQLNPSYSVGPFWYAVYQVDVGRLDDAIVSVRRAQELDPLSLIINSVAGWPYMLSGRDKEAFEQFQKVKDLDPNFYLLYWFEGQTYEREGKYDQAIEDFRKGVALSNGNQWLLGALAHALGRAGKRAEALGALKELQALRAKRYVSEYAFLEAYDGLGDRAHALQWLEQVVKRRNSYAFYVFHDPRMADLRKDPAFARLTAPIHYLGAR